jgi:hypothetical protein
MNGCAGGGAMTAPQRAKQIAPPFTLIHRVVGAVAAFILIAPAFAASRVWCMMRRAPYCQVSLFQLCHHRPGSRRYGTDAV